jgi:Na+/proline symporter
MLVVGLLASRRVETEEDYLVAGRRLPLWLAWGTLLATWFGAGTMLGASEAAREEGLPGVILDPFASGAALVVAGLFFARRMWEMKLLTMGDFFGRTYGPRTEWTSSIVQAVGYYPWIAAQYVALAAVLREAFGWSTPVGIAVAAGFVFVLTVSGGMWSVTVTDTAQVFVVLLGVAILGGATFAHLGNGSVAAGLQATWESTDAEMKSLLPEWSWLPVCLWGATWMNGVFGNIPGQDLMQRVFSAKDARTAQQACLLAGGMYLGFGLIPVFLGLASRIVLPQADSDGILIAMSRVYFSPLLRAVFTVSILSIVVSTATSALLSPSALLAHNVFGHFALFQRRKLVTDRLGVVLSVGLSLPFAFASPNVLGLLEEALAIAFVALVVPYLAGFWGRPRGDHVGLVSVILGGACWLAHRVAGWGLLPADVTEETATWLQTLLLFPSEFVGVAASAAGYLAAQQYTPSRGAGGTERTAPPPTSPAGGT